MRRTMSIAAVLVAAVALTACGTTEAPESESSAGGTVTVTDARGVEVEIPDDVESVVALEWVAVEQAQTVGIELEGVADVEGYVDWSGTAAPLQGDPTDVGTRQEPNLDTIADIAPDLIIDVAGRNDDLVADLEAIAPVVVLQGADASDPIGTMLGDLELVGDATGRADEAAAATEEFETHVDDVASAVSEAGLEGTPIAHIDGYENGGQIEIRTYTSGSLLVAALERVGFENAWTGEGDEQYGLGVTDVEGLTDLPADAQLVYLTVGDDDVFEHELSTNEIWTGLPFVEAGDVHRLPDGIWLFGGTSSVTAYLDAVLTALGASTA